MTERYLKEIVRHGSSEEVERALLTIEKSIERVTDWIQNNKPRNERNLVFLNFLLAAIPYVNLAGVHRDGPAQVLALCARSLYELCLRARQIRISDQAFQQWRAEFANDHIELLEGYLELSPDTPSPARVVVETELARMRIVTTKHGIQPRKPSRLDQIAKEVGDEREHRSLFKLFSKLLHPTSYLVNAKADKIQSDEVRNILIIHIQLYALSILEELRLELGVPKDIVLKITF